MDRWSTHFPGRSWRTGPVVRMAAGEVSPDLLRQVAGERELDSAKHVADVLHQRLEHRRVAQRTPTAAAADVASSSYPTPLSAASPPTRTAPVDPFAPGLGEHAHKELAAGTDPAALGAAVELGRGADDERQARRPTPQRRLPCRRPASTSDATG